MKKKPFPDIIASLYGAVPVLRERPDDIDKDAAGAFTSHPRRIFVDKNLSEEEAWHVLHHETYHCWAWDAGIQLSMPDGERAAQVYALMKYYGL